MKFSLLPLVAMVGVTAACPKSTGQEPEPEVAFSRSQLLENLADGVFVPTYQGFVDASGVLVDRARTYAAATGDARAAARADAQTAFLDAHAVWQRADLYQVGPAAPSYRPGGQNIRDEIYSFHDGVNPCAVDQQLVANEFGAAGYFDQRLIPTKGLDALEYVLFYDGADNQCPPPATINTSGAWAALTPAELGTRRERYAEALSQHLHTQAQRLVQAWSPEGDDFRKEFLARGETFSSERDALDAAFAALYYLELFTKDRKLSVPIGLHVDCAAAPCPEFAESLWSAASTRHIEQNLIAFRDAFSGNGGYGWSDALVAEGAEELATRMTSHLDAAIALVNAETRSVDELVRSDPEQAQRIYEAVKAVTDDLKSQFITVLNLSVPDEGAGDND